jgi:hypothetical protein
LSRELFPVDWRALAAPNLKDHPRSRARLSGGQYAQEGPLPSPAMDCSLWKVLPSLPVLRRHDLCPAIMQPSLKAGRLSACLKGDQIQVNGMGCQRPSNNCRFARYDWPGFPYREASTCPLPTLATLLTLTKLVETSKLAGEHAIPADCNDLLRVATWVQNRKGNCC